MKKVTNVPQQYTEDKANYTGKFGMGFLVIVRKTGEVFATAPTLEQAEAALARAEALADGKGYGIEDAGYTDSQGHSEDSPFRFRPL